MSTSPRSLFDRWWARLAGRPGSAASGGPRDSASPDAPVGPASPVPPTRVDRRAFSGTDRAKGDRVRIVPLDYPSASLRIYATTDVERKWRAQACAREPWTVRWLEHEVRQGDVVFDIGANVGAFSLIAATRVSPGGRVFAFEPGYPTFARLCDNVVLNKLDDVIVPVPMPLWSETAIIAFFYTGLRVGQSRHELQAYQPGVPMSHKRYRQPSFAFRLDDLIRLFGLPAPHHVKLDVDGGELQVLRGFGDVLAAPTLRTVLVEIDRALSDEVPALLTSHGLTLASRYEREGEGRGSPSWYGLFRREAIADAGPGANA